MGRDERANERRTLELVRSVGTHDGDQVHGFGHTGGICPKCGCPQQLRAFCKPGSEQRLRGCETYGEHLHLLCQGCKYVWVERCRDHALAAQQEGIAPVESEGAAALCAIARQTGGISLPIEAVEACNGWRIRRVRDPARGLLTITALEPEEGGGPPARPTLADVMPPDQSA